MIVGEGKLLPSPEDSVSHTSLRQENGPLEDPFITYCLNAEGGDSLGSI